MFVMGSNGGFGLGHVGLVSYHTFVSNQSIRIKIKQVLFNERGLASKPTVNNAKRTQPDRY